jgi:hypothetical protein
VVPTLVNQMDLAQVPFRFTAVDTAVPEALAVRAERMEIPSLVLAGMAMVVPAEKE